MAARVGGFLVDLLVLFLLDSWANWLFGVAVVTSAVHSGNSGTSTFVYQPPEVRC